MSTAPVRTASALIGSKRAWFIWCLSALTFGYAFFHRVAPSVMVNELMTDFAIGAAVLGTLSALYFYPYVLMQVPLGAIIDRIGARLLLTIALVIAGAGSLIFAVADNIAMAYVGRTLIGVGSAVGFLGTLAIAAKWFPPHRFGFLAGFVMFFGMISGMMAQGPLAGFVENFGWRAVMWSLGGFSLVLALMIFTFVRNQPEDIEVEDKPKESWSSVWSKLGKALSSLEVWKTAIVASTMSGPMLTLGGLWATPYLMVAYELERQQAAFFVSLLLLGWAFGAPFAGWLSDYIRKRKILLVSGAFVLTLCVAAIVFLPDAPLWLAVLLLALCGTSGAFMAITFPLIRENSPQEMSGSVTGIVNSMTVASGAVLQPAVGFVLDRVWDGTSSQGAQVYHASDFRTGFIVVLASTFLGFLVSLTLKESDFGNR